MVAPFDPELVNPASLDIRVGNTAKLRTQKGYKDIDLSKYSKETPYALRQGDRVLIDSLETFHIPNFIRAVFYMKSSRGREWYEGEGWMKHINARFVDPGWYNSVLTMELVNMDLVPLPIYTGMRIGQLEFSLMLAIPEKSYADTGRYNNDEKVQESKG
jgi:dCTP deaminase